MEKKILSVQEISVVAMFVAVMAVCSWISIPIGPVPFTLQTFAVFVVGGILGVKKGFVTVAVYILLGLVGVPVFSGFSCGPGVLVGPTGGFIIGFLFTVLVIGSLLWIFRNVTGGMKNVILLVSMIIGDAICFALGTIQFIVVMKSTVTQALGLCVIPYIVPDIIKMILATIVINRLQKYVKIFQ